MSAKDYIDNARRVADRASGVSVVLFAGLLISVLSDFGPKLATFRDAAVAERMQSHHESNRTVTASLEPNRLKELRDIVDRLTKQHEEIKKKIDSDPRNVPHAIAEESLRVSTRLENAKDNLDQTMRAYSKASETAAATRVLRDAQRRATEDVKLKGFGFELGVRGSWASVVWLLMFLIGIVNLSFARFSFAAEVRAGAKDDQVMFETLRVPLWLHPISDSPLGNASAIVFFDTLALAVVLLATGCAAAAFWMARLTLAAPVLLAPGHEMQGWLAGIAVGCLIAAILVTVSTWAIPVRLTHPNKGIVNTVRRRMLLAFPILAVTCSAAAVPAPLRRALQQTLLNPRRRRRVREVVLASGFYVHKKTQKIHYVPVEGHAKSLRGADMDNFTKVDPATLKAAHLPFVHVKALVPYSRQMVLNLGRDHNASAALLAAVLTTREARSLRPVPATGLTESGRDRTRRRKKGGSARSHGQQRRKSRHHQNRMNQRQQSGMNPPVQLLQICDLLARFAAGTRNSRYLEIASGHVLGLRFPMNDRGRNSTFAQRAEQIKDGVESRLIPKKQFTLRRFESALRHLEESSERRKHESDLLQLMKARSSALNDVVRLEQRAKRREQVWSSRIWTSDYNRKIRFPRRRAKRKKAKAVRVTRAGLLT
jgi:hypothetical protein